MSFILELLMVALLAIGSVFVLVGSFGLVKLSDFFKRLHGPTKASTLGIGATLVASMLYFLLVEGDPSVRELLIAVFLFLTAPVTAHMLSKAHILRDKPLHGALPGTGRPVGWATLDPAQADAQSETTKN